MADMQIYVCVKHVPDSAAGITITGDTGIDRNTPFLLNPFDEHAVTEAVKIRENFSSMAGEKSDVIAVCLGSEDAHDTIQSALEMGSDRGILIQTKERHDSITTAKALKKAIEKDGRPDMILTGRESIDAEGMQTMFRIGKLFNFPAANNIVKIDFEDEHAVVDHALANGVINTYKLTLPCVLGTGKGLNTPRYPTFKDVVKARRKEIKRVDLNDLNLEPSSSFTDIVKLEPLKSERTPEEIKGTAVEAAGKIIQILKHKAKVIS